MLKRPSWKYGPVSATKRSEGVANGPLRLETGPLGTVYLDIGRPGFGLTSYVQAVRQDGKTFRTFGEGGALPVSKQTLKLG